MMQVVTQIERNDQDEFPALTRSKPISFHSSRKSSETLSKLSNDAVECIESKFINQSLKKRKTRRKKSSSQEPVNTFCSANENRSFLRIDGVTPTFQDLSTQLDFLAKSTSNPQSSQLAEDEGFFADEDDDSTRLKPQESENATTEAEEEEDDDDEGVRSSTSISTVRVATGKQQPEEDDDAEGADLLDLISNSLDRFNAILHPNQPSNLTSGLGESEGVLSEGDFPSAKFTPPTTEFNLPWCSASCPVNCPLAGDCISPGPGVISSQDSFGLNGDPFSASFSDECTGDRPVDALASSSDATAFRSLSTSVQPCDDRDSPLGNLPSLVLSNPFWPQSPSKPAISDMDRLMTELEWLQVAGTRSWHTEQPLLTRLNLVSSAPAERRSVLESCLSDQGQKGASSTSSSFVMPRGRGVWNRRQDEFRQLTRPRTQRPRPGDCANPSVAKWRRACSFYLRGHCKKEDCEFAHDLTKVTCKFWEMGECFKGSTCPFLHGYPPEWNRN